MEWVMLDEPKGDELPAAGFAVDDNGYIAPDDHFFGEVVIAPGSNRLQAAWDGKDFTPDVAGYGSRLKGSGTTDHISMAGPWLRFRGHLESRFRTTWLREPSTLNGA